MNNNMDDFDEQVGRRNIVYIYIKKIKKDRCFCEKWILSKNMTSGLEKKKKK